MTVQNPSSDIILNPVDNTASWVINLEGDIGGSYKGQFVFKCFLNPLEQLAASRAYRDLLGPHIADSSDTDRFLAYSLSQLKFRIVKAPPFWKTENGIDGGHILDLNVISSVFGKSVEAMETYKQYIEKRKKESLENAEKSAEKLQEEMNLDKKESQ